MVLWGKGPDYLLFTRLPEISEYSYEVSACLGGRSVTNDSLTFLDVENFLIEVEEFERKRSGMAELKGTYDFRLAIAPHGRAGAAWVGFYLAEFLFVANGQYGRHALEGGLVIDGEWVGQAVRELTELLRSS